MSGELGSAENPVRVGNAVPDPDRHRRTSAVLGYLHPLVCTAADEFGLDATVEALVSETLSVVVSALGAERARELLVKTADQAPLIAAIHAGRREPRMTAIPKQIILLIAGA